jgi:putative membrane protein
MKTVCITHVRHFARITRFTSAALAVIATAVAGSIAAAQATTTSAGDVVNFAQRHLVDHMIVGDSIDVEMAQLAATRAQNPAVKEFANQLVTARKAHLEQLTKLAAKGDIGREANPSDTSGAHLAGQLASLRSMAADSGFDRAFVHDQIEDHQAAISTLGSTRAAATNADVQHDIDATLPALAKHLSAAQALEAQLSKPADAAPAKADSIPQKADTSTAKTPVAKPPVAKPPV